MFRYRTYRRPRYKVAYKMVTEMEWKCCHGYSGEDCHDGPKVTTDSQVTGGRPHGSQTGHSSNGGHTGGSGGNQGSKKTARPSIYSGDVLLLGHKRQTSCIYIFFPYAQVILPGSDSWRKLSRAWQKNWATCGPPCKELTRGCKRMFLMPSCSFTSQSAFTCTPEHCLHTGSWIRANLTCWSLYCILQLISLLY